MERQFTVYKNEKYPQWFLDLLKTKRGKHTVGQHINDLNLHTVCSEARCPNRGECFSSGTATFLILGNVCTRNCRFCAIDKGKPSEYDLQEPERVLEAVKRMNLRYVVITSVTRDDLDDGGAEIFRKTIALIRQYDYTIKMEVLTPDFMGKKAAVKLIIDEKPDVFNHNVETVPRLYEMVRPMASYQMSLDVLAYARECDSECVTKSGIMVGLGETNEEVYSVMRDLKKVGCSIVTIGQYIQPTDAHIPVHSYVEPDVYEHYTKFGTSIGLTVVAGPLVRSSYFAHDAYDVIKRKENV